MISTCSDLMGDRKRHLIPGPWVSCMGLVVASLGAFCLIRILLEGTLCSLSARVESDMPISSPS